ncbi:MAG: tetratricopeptide repeat protein [Gammaproteobacteria bacterium]|nr:tetratricopeptide repeat protein [Gammaproteobacteria bacterium]
MKNDSQRREQALAWYEAAFEAGLPQAQYRMATFYQAGQYFNHRADYLEIFEKACAQDYAPACNDIGVHYLEKLHYRQAPDYLLKAIRLGSIVAISNLAYMYASGLGVQADENRSQELYLEAAMLGRNMSQLQVAMNYYRGIGVGKDYKRSYAWALVSELDETDPETSAEAQTTTENVRFMLERLLSVSQKEQSLTLARELLDEIDQNRTAHLAQYGDRDTIHHRRAQAQR